MKPAYTDLPINKRKIYFITGLILLVILLNIFVYWYLTTEKTVYYWDLSGYWTPAIEMTNMFHLGELRELAQMILNSFNTDYNYLPLVPLIPIMKLFGVSRMVYVLSIVNLYIIPAALLSVYNYYIFRKHTFNWKMALCSCAIIMFLPSLLLPALRGQIDAVGLLVIGVIVLTFQKINHEKFSYAYILLGLELTLLMVLRRWYAYWVVSAFIALGIVSFYKYYKTSENKKEFLKKVTNFLRNVTVTGVVIISVMFLLFNHLFRAYLLDYSNIYSAYRNGDMFDQIQNFLYYFGILSVIMMVIGYVITFYKKHTNTITYVAGFFIIQSLVIFLLFTSTQNFAAHHYYLLLPVFVFSYISIVYLGMARAHIFRERLFFVLLIIVVLMSFTSSFIINGKNDVRHRLLGEINYPIVRGDLLELKKMIHDINDMRNASDTIYVLSSSDVLNDSIVRDINLPEGFVDGVVGTAHVDKRDGFPYQLFHATYIITTIPTQTHLPTGQMVIVEPSEYIQHNTFTNLVQVGRVYHLDNNVQALVYRRTGAYDQDTLNSLIDTFKKQYKNDSFLHIDAKSIQQ